MTRVSAKISKNYILTYRTWFDKCTEQEGFVGVVVNGYAIGDVDACHHDGIAGVWQDNAVEFTPVKDPITLRFEFITSEERATMKLDNIVVGPSGS